MKRKLVSLMCMVSMMSAMLSGCGGRPGGEGPKEASKPGREESRESKAQPTEEGTSEEAEAGAGDLEYVELKWDALSYQPDNIKDLDLIQAALDEYFKEKLNCRVVLNPMTIGAYLENVPTKLMSGEEMDLITVNSDVPYNNYANMGAFFPIDTLWDEYGSDVKLSLIHI